MSFTFYNVHHILKSKTPAHQNFLSIWKVTADKTYDVRIPQGFSEHGLFFTCQGEGRFISADGKEIVFYPPSAFILPKYSPCRYYCAPGFNWHFYFLHFRHIKIAEEFGLTPGLCALTKYASRAGAICEHIIDEIINQSKGHCQLAQALFTELLSLFRPQSDSASAGLALAKQLVHSNASTPPSISELLAVTGLGRTAFFNEFKKLTGVTPAQYSLNFRLETAAAMLRTTVKKAREVAHELGFSDEYYFSRQFKSRFGKAPLSWKKSII